MEDLKIYYRKGFDNGDYVRPNDITVDKLSITHAQIPAEAVAKLNVGEWFSYLNNGEDTALNICGRVFRYMNHDEANPLSCYHVTGGHQQWVRDNDTHTSMSVGDVVCIMGEYLMCDRIGWTPLV